MDAHALLTSQGWRGSGHSLHPTSDNNGLLRPLLVSKKQNNLGVGKKQHSTSDMWWMNAFDKSLKGLDTTKEGKVVQTLTTGALDMVVKGGSKFVGNRGLYASFVRGESLSGTITPEESVEARAAGQKRRAEDKGEGKERRKANKATARTARAHSLVVSEPLVTTTSSEPAEIDGGEEDATVTAPKTKAELRERRKRKKLMCKAKEQSTEEVMSTAKRRKRRKS